MTTVDDRVSAYLLAALERIAALPNAGPANEAARAALNEARRLRGFLEHEERREIHYVTEAVAGLLNEGPLDDRDAVDLGLGQPVDRDGHHDLELTDLGRAVVRELIIRRHPEIRLAS